MQIVRSSTGPLPGRSQWCAGLLQVTASWLTLGQRTRLGVSPMKRIANHRLLSAVVVSGVLALGTACSSLESPEEDTGRDLARSTVAAPEPTAPPLSQPSRDDDDANESAYATTEELVEYASESVVRVAILSGVGSGFIIDSDGYIVTNYHVVEAGLNDVTVTLADGARLPAVVVGIDPRADLAVLKIETSAELQALELADLDHVGVGQDVVAIGFALDLTGGSGPPSVTRGIVSAKNRPIQSSGILGAIQTDTAINHGNSGGPLVNYEGKVVGVNTSLAPDRTSSTGLAQNIGFAVGADTIAAVYAEIRETGEVRRAFLGIGSFAALRPSQAETLGLDRSQTGILVNDVSGGGPASVGGMLPSDVIVRVGDTDIQDESDLAVAMVVYDPGETVDVEVYRNGSRTELSVTLGAAANQ